MSNLPAAVVPPIWYKAKRVIRTVLAVIVSLLITVGATGAALELLAPQILPELALVLPSGAISWLAAVVAFFVLLSGIITRIMAIPGVNTWLVKIGAGSVPASAVVTDIAGTFVMRDPRLGE